MSVQRSAGASAMSGDATYLSTREVVCMICPSLLLKMHPKAAVFVSFFHDASEKPKIRASRSGTLKLVIYPFLSDVLYAYMDCE